MSAAEMSTWDVVVIGGGPPGENAAKYAIQGSDRTAVIVEQELVGGECSYWACMPSKALLRPIEILDAARALPGLSADLEVAPVLNRRDDFTSHHDDSSQVEWARNQGIDVLRGHGVLVGERTVEVSRPDGSTQMVQARRAVVVATGSTASMPPVAGLKDALPWTSRDVTNLHELPRRVAVLGGGVVACESATWLNGLGAEELTIIEVAPRLLGSNEPFAGELLAERFGELGARVLLGTKVDSVERDSAADTGEGRIHGGPVSLSIGGSEIEVDEIVVAAGRSAASSGIGLESVGLEAGGFVETDDHMTLRGLSGDWLYAVGDVTGRALLTHMGKYQARICGSVIAARAEGRSLDGPLCNDVADHGIVPAVVFTDPQVASVGLTESAAREQGLEVETVEVDMAPIAGAALLRDGYVGRAKLVIDREPGLLVGATFVGAEVAELLHSATVAIAGRVPVDTLWHAVPSYPTISEVWLRLLEARN